MTTFEIYNILDEISPFELQESWDNSGLIVGSQDTDVENIYLSIDIDSKLIEKAQPNSLIITHHPLIFGSVKTLDFSKFPANIIQKMIKKDISLISMHTNFDKTHLNKYLVENVLGYEISEREEYVCSFEVNKDFSEFAEEVRKKMNLPHLKTVKTGQKIKRAAVMSGSGADFIGSVDVDCFLTGDIKYHQAFEAKENKTSLIDIGHFESEVYFSECLEQNLKNIGIKAIIANSKNPFEYL